MKWKIMVSKHKFGYAMQAPALGLLLFVFLFNSANAASLVSLPDILIDYGVSLHIQHTNDMQAMVNDPTPGMKKGVGTVGIATYGIDVDWERLSDVRGVSTHIILASGYGAPTSRKFGDYLTPSQATYGGVGNVVIHLASVYIERAMFYDRLNLAAGRMIFLSDFSANPLYCNFMNAAFCGNPRAASDNTAHAAFPTATWAVRVRVHLLDALVLQSGVYFTQGGEQYALSQMRSGFKFNGATIDGEAIPLELAWSPRPGRGGTLPGHYKIGFVYDTAPHRSLYEDHDGGLIVLTGGAPRVMHGSWAGWILADQRIIAFPGQGPDAGVTLLGVAYWNNPRTQLRETQYSLGVIIQGLFRTRPQDSFALNIAYMRLSHRVREAQRHTGPEEPGGIKPVRQDSAAVIELFYQLHIMRGISIVPDIQYYIHPNGQRALRDQLMIGVKSHIEFI